MKATRRILPVAAALLFAQPASGATVIVPNALGAVEGNLGNRYPFGIQDPLNPQQLQIPSMRYQQVYAASEFASVHVGGELITEIRFRPDMTGTAFSSTLPDIQINLSTTSAAPDGLSATFADNVGADNTVAFPRGPLSLSSGFTGPAAGPKAFDIVISLTTPFFYNPAVGNLLLDVRNFGGGFTTFFDAQDVLSDAISRRFASSDIDIGNVDRPTGSPGTVGLVTQFTTVVPEPTGVSGLIVGSALLLTRRRMVS